MYSKDQIQFLMSNGFSLEEIMSMSSPEPEPDPQPEPQPDPEPEPQPDPEPEPKPARRTKAKPEPQPDQQIGQVVTAVNELIRTIQAQNVNGIQFGNPVERNVQDVLAEIINPPAKNK